MDKNIGDDFVKAAEDKFEWLASKIPGLSEYRGRDRLRDQDRVLREATAGQLRLIKSSLDARKEKALAAGGLAGLGDWDRLSGRLDTLIHKISNTAGGYGALFGESAVTSADLSRWYDLDAKLLEKAKEAVATAGGAVDAAAVGAIVDELAVLIDDRRAALSERG